MQLERHVTDFVQEQRAPFSLLETAPAHGLRAGERAAFVAEEFALEQVFGDGCGVDGHKGAAGARRMLVQGPRHQFLAGAGFARDEHGDMALAQTPDGAKYILHGRCLAQHFRRLGLLLLGNFLALALFNGTTDQLYRLGHIEGFGQVFKSPALKSTDGTV